MKESTHIKQLDDAALINFYKLNGDTVYVGVLFEKYTHLVFGVCMKYLKDEDEAKDAVMVIFENLLVSLKKHEVTYFKAWLHTVSKNHCLMVLRNAKKEVSYVDTIHVENHLPQHLDEKIELEGRLNLLEAAIEELDPQQKTCIRLFYIEEKSYQQIISQTGFDFNQVKSFIQNGKRNLKIYMQKNEGHK